MVMGERLAYGSLQVDSKVKFGL